MVSKLALLSNLLLASMAMSVPSSQLGARLARGEDLQLQPSNRDVSNSSAGIVPDTTITYNWAGVRVIRNAGPFQTVTATFTVPTSSGADGGALVWVGAGGPTCGSTFLSGLRVRIRNGEIFNNAVWQWYPTQAHYFPVNRISIGDQITFTVDLATANFGRATVVNHSRGWMMSQTASSPVSVCNYAEWIVEDYQSPPGTYVPFANFDGVTFRNALASRPGDNCNGPNTPNACTVLDADLIYDITQSGLRLTSTLITEPDPAGGPLLTIDYL